MVHDGIVSGRHCSDSSSLRLNPSGMGQALCKDLTIQGFMVSITRPTLVFLSLD